MLKEETQEPLQGWEEERFSTPFLVRQLCCLWLAHQDPCPGEGVASCRLAAFLGNEAQPAVCRPYNVNNLFETKSGNTG